MSAISQLLLTWFWPNFKSRFQGPFWTDSNCHDDICPGNNCPGNICPYQNYLSCYWPDFDQTLKVDSWENLEVIPTVMVTFVQAIFVLATFVHIRNISADTAGNLFNRCQLSWWHLSQQHLSWQHLSISGISQFLLKRVWPNFKSRFLAPSWTDSNCHGDICPGNHYPGNICPY